ncbi:MAG: hypothetical protein V4543_11190 [Bacteroidota bacterium]
MLTEVPRGWDHDPDISNNIPENLPFKVEDVIYRERIDFEGDPVFDVVIVMPEKTELKLGWKDRMMPLRRFLWQKFAEKDPERVLSTDFLTVSDFPQYLRQ